MKVLKDWKCLRDICGYAKYNFVYNHISCFIRIEDDIDTGRHFGKCEEKFCPLWNNSLPSMSKIIDEAMEALNHDQP